MSELCKLEANGISALIFDIEPDLSFRSCLSAGLLAVRFSLREVEYYASDTYCSPSFLKLLESPPKRGLSTSCCTLDLEC